MKNRVQKSLFITGLLMLLASGAMAAKDNQNGLKAITFDGPYDEAIVNGAIHVLAQQCDDGGWGWPHNDCSAPVSPYNTISPIVDGVLAAYDKTDLSVFMNSAVDAADFNLGSIYDANGTGAGAGSPRLASQTALNLWYMSARTGYSDYTDWVQTGFYDALQDGTGTYGANADMGTADYIAVVRSSPPWQNLKAWEFSSQALAAERYCYQGIADQFEQGILDALANLDGSYPVVEYHDIIGVVGGVLGLARVNRLDFPAIDAPSHSGVDEKTTLAGLADYLVSLQNGNGSFNWHSGLPLPTTGDESTQTTAYAVLALIKAQERLPNKDYLPAIDSAKFWLTTVQDADGGFPSYTGSASYNTEIEAEAIHALGKEGVYDRIFQGQMECYVN